MKNINSLAFIVSYISLKVKSVASRMGRVAMAQYSRLTLMFSGREIHHSFANGKDGFCYATTKTAVIDGGDGTSSARPLS